MMSERVEIVEVGPRDGLQNEARVIPVAAKVALIDSLTRSGLPEVEIGSFVSPKWVPQMAETDKVMQAIDYGQPSRLTVLIPNMTGWHAFQAACDPLVQTPERIAVFVSASEGFSRANLNCSVAESIERLRPVVAAAIEAGKSVRGYVSCVTHCPFDGPVDPARTAAVVAELRGLADMQVSLGDTIGAATPADVTRLLDHVLGVLPADRLAGHFHDTGGQALRNIEAALDRGLRVFDSAVGGLGGCPYAPGAPGNVATEAVLDRLDQLGFDTGIDRDGVARAAEMARDMRRGSDV
jgi:hydroxymethylglutaryl-CoA lyase